MSYWSELLDGLAREYHRRLSNGELNRRLAHHLCHVAPELWLSQELAYLVNSEGAMIGFKGWNALLEVQRVDVTLIPPVSVNHTDPIYLELKLVSPDYWLNWYEVYHDLACHPEKPTKNRKPRAHFAICFLVDTVSQSPAKRRPDTIRRYREWLARLPSEPGPFQPIDEPNLPLLWLEYSSPPIRAYWPDPVYSKWPMGYESIVRILWVSSHM